MVNQLLTLEPEELKNIKSEVHGQGSSEIQCHTYLKTLKKNGKDKTFEVCVKAKKNRDASKYVDSVEVYTVPKKRDEEKSLHIFRRFHEPKKTLIDLPMELQKIIVEEAYFKGEEEETNLALLASSRQTREVTSASLHESIDSGASPVAKFIEDNKKRWSAEKLSDKKIQGEVDDFKKRALLEKHGSHIKSTFGDAVYATHKNKFLALPPTGMKFVATHLHLLNGAYTPTSLINLASLSAEKRDFVKKYQSRFLIEAEYGRGVVKNGDYINWLASRCDSPEKLKTLLKNFPNQNSNSPFAVSKVYGPFKKPFGEEGPIPPAHLVHTPDQLPLY
ncbi:hypothetical protein GCM10009425_47910 [Pseudomonas asuensis]|uniref:Uncharacterized protein n=2 Tax=Pseudomonas asuensis TaxID=1825787 RepID=A0ABQ2H3E2_9PSED|nr:hypothetical protein GCM10009425_47910 [Pseudomonas asuensis]